MAIAGRNIFLGPDSNRGSGADKAGRKEVEDSEAGVERRKAFPASLSTPPVPEARGHGVAGPVQIATFSWLEREVVTRFASMRSPMHDHES